MISIIIPAYNEESYILKTINSIKDQTFKDFEIIVVDDGSTDKTSNVVKNEVDFLVRLNKKSGPAVARNAGAARARGELLVFLDADTSLSPKVLEKIYEKKNDYTIGTCRILPDNPKLKHRLVMGFKNNFLCPFGISNGILFFSKDTYKKYGPFNEEMKKREEGALLRTIKKHGKFIIIDEPVTSSTRRFDKQGYINNALYWMKEAFKPSNEEYEVIR